MSSSSNNSQEADMNTKMQEKVQKAHNDERGIALQTVVVIVVLLLIAGAVAGVLVQKAGQETTKLDKVNTSVYETTRSGCDIFVGATFAATGTPNPTTPADPGVCTVP